MMIQDFEELRSKHDLFQRQLVEHSNSANANEIRNFMKNIQASGSTISDFEEREQLRSFLRYWGMFIYDHTGEYPSIQLQPYGFSSMPEKKMPKNIIGRYEIREKIYSGTTSDLFRAYDPLFQRDVAIKILKSYSGNEQSILKLFKEEVQKAASLEHSGVVPIYDFNQLGNEPYVVMRFMPGGTLADRIKQKPFSLTETIRILQDVIHTLDEIHENGNFHGNLKPENILFDKYNDPYLSDFNSSYIKIQSYQLQLTAKESEITNNFIYASPEQIEAKKIDKFTDIYALGLIFYEMLTRNHVFSGNIAELINHHLNSPIPKITDKQPDLPPICNEIVFGALAKSPKDRFQNVKDFSEIFMKTTQKSNISNTYSATPHATIMPSLETTEKQIFNLQGRSNLIGRPDPTSLPDIDLSSIDNDDVVSRRHAQIWRNIDGEYWIKDLRSTNSTIVNGKQLKPGERTQIYNDTKIQFGVDGPILFFHY